MSTGSVLPARAISRRSRTASSLICNSRPIASISSRNSVPPLADVMRPDWPLEPNRSASSICGLNAAQFTRVSAVTVVIPPLRDRREDIPLLAEELLRRHAGNGNGGRAKPVPTKISAHATELLMDYHWPGNILELEHTVERATTMASSDTIEPKDILLPKASGQSPADIWPEMNASLTATISGVERKLIDAALRRATGNQAKAAQFLGIPRTTLRDKMAKYGMVGNALAGPVMPPSQS